MFVAKGIGMGPVFTRKVRVAIQQGLHARASGAVAQLCEIYEAEAVVRFDGEVADACSIIELLMLAAPQGSLLEIEAFGSDAEAMVDAIVKLIGDETELAQFWLNREPLQASGAGTPNVTA